MRLARIRAQNRGQPDHEGTSIGNGAGNMHPNLIRGRSELGTPGKRFLRFILRSGSPYLRPHVGRRNKGHIVLPRLEDARLQAEEHLDQQPLVPTRKVLAR